MLEKAYHRSCHISTLSQRTFSENTSLIAVDIQDNVIIFSEDPSQHVGDVRSILQFLGDHKLYAKAEKCEFHNDSVIFVGYLVSKTGIGMDPAKVLAILAHPQFNRGSPVFLGFPNFYCKFI